MSTAAAVSSIATAAVVNIRSLRMSIDPVCRAWPGRATRLSCVNAQRHQPKEAGAARQVGIVDRGGRNGASGGAPEGGAARVSGAMPVETGDSTGTETEAIAGSATITRATQARPQSQALALSPHSLLPGGHSQSTAARDAVAIIAAEGKTMARATRQASRRRNMPPL